MNKRVITKLLALFVIAAFLLPGCSSAKAPASDASGEQASSQGTDLTESEEPSSSEDTKDTSAPEDTTEESTEATTEEPSSETTEETTEVTTEATSEETTSETTEETTVETTKETTVETTEAPELVHPEPKPLDPDSDYLEQLESLRSHIIANADYYNSLDNNPKESWCFKRMDDHSQSYSYEYFDISEYNGVYVNKNVSDDDKVIYLTFDCGYPSDKTATILDILAEHNAKASFFVTKMYLEECSDYAIRMKEEGHMVCNHTVTHSDLVPMDVEQICSEIFDVAEYFYNKTGYTLDPYFRTPKGTYTKKLMTILTDAGYKTVFWSIAYNDYSDEQPEPGYVTNHFATYHHNGAIALMHNDSSSNVAELDAVLTLLENEGYRFGLLNELN
ncbi:MAG: polysaccharide deacetylase family protein [Clostridiales bacterium]|nr:polysaccharide deacetylase family protein [Clostridiales bacterium]